jgi:hypothetical protein
MPANLIVNLSDNRAVNGKLHRVVLATIKKFSKLFSMEPPTGFRPIRVLYQSEHPQIDATTDTEVYIIYLTVADFTPNQLIFQLGHELGHIFFDPRRTNWFVESCCQMMSQIILCRMYEVWPSTMRFLSDRVIYAPKIEAYGKEQIQRASDKIFGSKSLPEEAEIMKWFTSVKDTLHEPYWHFRNRIIGEILRPIFEESKSHLDALCFLGQASTSPPTDLMDYDEKSGFEFDKWFESVPPHLKGLVNRLRVKLA